MANTYVLPVGDEPAEGLALDLLFQAAAAGITGLSGDLVRPRFQVNPPKRPEPTVDWCAIAATVQTPDATPWMQSDDSPDPGMLLFWRHEQLDVLASFMGPNSAKYAARLRDGIMVRQNMEGLEADEIYLVGVDMNIRRIPEFINQQWNDRNDVALNFNRKAIRTYPVGRFKTANVHLFDDTTFDATVVVPLIPPSGATTP